MTAMNYSDLVDTKATDGSIKRWVNRTDTPSAHVLTEAQAKIYQELRAREMMYDEVVTVSATGDNSNSYALSGLTNAPLLEPIAFVPYTWLEPLPMVDIAQRRPYRDTAGDLTDSETPSYCYILGDTLYVDVDLTSDLVGRFYYYGTPPALAASTNETNFLTQRYPSLLRYMCLHYAYEFAKQEKEAVDYMAKAEQAIAVANATNEMYRRGMVYYG